MAIKKNSSRFTDRNKIRRMHAEGYSVQQIADSVSITLEHVDYVINQWDADEENWKNQQRAIREAQMDAAAEKARPEHAVPSVDDQERSRLIELGRRQALEELKREHDGQAKTEDEITSEEEETSAKEPPKRRNRRRKEAVEAA